MNVAAALDHLESHSALRHVPASRPPSCLSGGERLLLDLMESLRSGLLFDAAARLDDANWLAVVGAVHALRPIDVRKYGAFVFDTPERASDRIGELVDQHTGIVQERDDRCMSLREWHDELEDELAPPVPEAFALTDLAQAIDAMPTNSTRIGVA